MDPDIQHSYSETSPWLPQADLYFCPGESAPVSAAVHQARLVSGWSGCDQCRFRSSATELSPRQARRLTTAAAARSAGIRRTASGVRGAYLNELDRSTAAQLASIFSTHLANSQAAVPDPDQPFAEGTSRTNLRPAPRITVVAGFDGRRHSPDIFAGVVSAATQNGCDVIDIGRCTTASLHECLRSVSEATAGMMVTGAGQPPSMTGLDVFDRTGEAVCVPWQQFGVAVQVVRETAAATEPLPGHDQEPGDELHSREIHQALQKLRNQPAVQASATRAATGPAAQRLRMPETRLTLPSLQDGPGRIFRAVRASGRHRSLDFEPRHRDWLQRWFPSTISGRAVLFTEDSLTAARLRSIAKQPHNSTQLLVNEAPGLTFRHDLQASVSSELRRFDAEAAFVIGEDDRRVQVFERNGRLLSAAELARWINRAAGGSANHITAHVSEDEARVSLLDAGRPQSGHSHETLHDGLALTGLILRLLNHRDNSLPA